jgi:hypothetical protein
MPEDSDQIIEKTIREGWAANGLPPDGLPPSDDPRMKGLIDIMRQGRRQAEVEITRLKRREREIELRLADLEARVRRVEEQVGLGHTLQ